MYQFGKGHFIMVKENEVLHIAELADIGISSAELGKFTEQFNAILEYFDILDTLEASGPLMRPLVNVFREDEVTPSISQEDALRNSHNPEDGYVRAPRVI
jgi:aspartyl-tRNA(Asn)/glutamyl-tRNA(Gln) amidotransferase subunit C